LKTAASASIVTVVTDSHQITGIAELTRERMRLRITGADRVEFLHGQCTNDIKQLAVGQSCYAAFLNAKGKMRGDGHVIHVPDAFLLETSPGINAILEKYVVTEDVVIEDLSGTLREWLMIGPPAPLPAGGVTFTHSLGLGVLSAAAMTPTLDAMALDLLRIEAGVPKFGVDMDENTIPVEAGLGARGISYDKGCYVGQETIARIKTYGHVNRQLLQLAVAGSLVPAPQTKIFAGDKEVGQVTSAVQSIRLGKVIALGYVRREFVATGTQLRVGEQPAEVIKQCAA
jgi:folate-binding protein YgfZ